MHLLVTGAAGELGTAVLQALEAGVRHGDVAPPDRVLTADLAERLPCPPESLPVEHAPIDLADPAAVETLPLAEIDSVVHCASPTGVRAERDLAGTLALNVELTRRLAFALPSGARLLFASSVAAIGDFGAAGPAGEDAPLRPRGGYGTAKAMTELLLQHLRDSGRCDARALRLPTLLVRRAQRRGRPSTGFLSDLVKAFRADAPFTAPAPLDFPIAVAAGRTAAAAMVTALRMDAPAWGRRAVANLPAVPATANEVLAVLRELHRRPGPPVAAAPDPDLMARIGGWPSALVSRLPQWAEPAPPDRSLERLLTEDRTAGHTDQRPQLA